VDRATNAVSHALASPLLNDNDISGAKYILLNITSGDDEISMDEIDEITDYIQNETGYTADLIWGNGKDESLGENICVTIIATGFGPNNIADVNRGESHSRRVVRGLNDEVDMTVSQPGMSDEDSAKENELSKSDEKPTEGEPFLKPKSNDPEKENQFTIRFGTPVKKEEDSPVEETENIVRHSIDEEVVSANNLGEKKIPHSNVENLPNEEQLRKSQERIMRLKALSVKMKTSSGISDLENEPAYKRRMIKLDDIPHSSEDNISRYTLSEDEDNKTKLRENNSFLHDNVD
jgi:cell division protein FtsZ